MEGIVVGIDHSAGARVALEWAAKAAEKFDAPLHVVHVHDITQVWMQHAYDEVSSAADIDRIRRHAEDTRQQARTKTQAIVDELGLGDSSDVDIHVVDDHRPARKLVELAADAEMLVVGSRGRGGVAGMLLGSVSQQCAHHAMCPIVIIHEPK